MNNLLKQVYPPLLRSERWEVDHGKIASKSYLNGLKSGSFTSNLNKLPTKSEIVSAGFTVKGSYGNNQLVQESDCSAPLPSFTIETAFSWGGGVDMDNSGGEFTFKDFKGWNVTLFNDNGAIVYDDVRIIVNGTAIFEKNMMVDSYNDNGIKISIGRSSTDLYLSIQIINNMSFVLSKDVYVGDRGVVKVDA